MSLDEWKIRSPSCPIRIPRKNDQVTIGTFNNMYMIVIKSISNDLLR